MMRELSSSSGGEQVELLLMSLPLLKFVGEQAHHWLMGMMSVQIQGVKLQTLLKRTKEIILQPLEQQEGCFILKFNGL